MTDNTKVVKWIGIPVAVLMVVMATIYVCDFSLDELTPRQARAALAEAGWCDEYAPIVRHEGKLLIGRYECDLENKTWRSHPTLSPNLFHYRRVWSWCPFFGEWTTRPRIWEGHGVKVI